MTRKAGEARKAEILAITADIIFNEGFANCTVRSVAGRVGISEAAIYRHFANKEELMLGLLDSLFEPWKEALGELAATEIPSVRKLQKLVELHLHHLVSRQLNPVLFFSQANMPENRNLLEKLRSNLGYLGKVVQKIVKDGIGAGEFRRDIDVEATTACIIGLLQTAVIKWTLQRQADGLVEHAAGLMNFFSSLIVNKGRKI